MRRQQEQTTHVEYGATESVLITAVVLVAAWACGQPATREQAVTCDEQDPQLQWGRCRGFMPAGYVLAVLHGDPAKPKADVFLRICQRHDAQSTGIRAQSA